MPVFLFASFLGALILNELIAYLLDESGKSEHNFALVSCFALIAAGHWTYHQRDSYYIANGEKKRMYEENEFFFLSMEVWAYIFWTISGFCFLAGVLSFFGLVSFS